jgi:hypothetical protein
MSHWQGEKIVRVLALQRYRFQLTFDDGVAGTVDSGDVALFKDSPMSRFWGHWTAKVRYAMPDMK